MNDAGPGTPEAEAVLARGRPEEVVDLVALADRALQILRGAALRADQMVAMERRRHGDALASRHHELEERHLPGDVLQRDAVHAQVEDRLAALPLLLLEIVAMRDEDFLRQRERATELAAGLREILRHGGVERFHLRGGHQSLLEILVDDQITLTRCAMRVNLSARTDGASPSVGGEGSRSSARFPSDTPRCSYLDRGSARARPRRGAPSSARPSRHRDDRAGA